MVPRHSLALALLPLLAACGGSGGGGKVATAAWRSNSSCAVTTGEGAPAGTCSCSGRVGVSNW